MPQISQVWLNFTSKIKENQKQTPKIEGFSFISHICFPNFFSLTSWNFSVKNKTKINCNLPGNEKSLCFQVMLLSSSSFQSENPTRHGKGFSSSLPTLELTDGKLRPWVNMVPRLLFFKARVMPVCFLQLSDCPAGLIEIQTNGLWWKDWLLCTFLIMQQFVSLGVKL